MKPNFTIKGTRGDTESLLAPFAQLPYLLPLVAFEPYVEKFKGRLLAKLPQLIATITESLLAADGLVFDFVLMIHHGDAAIDKTGMVEQSQTSVKATLDTIQPPLLGIESSSLDRFTFKQRVKEIVEFDCQFPGQSFSKQEAKRHVHERLIPALGSYQFLQAHSHVRSFGLEDEVAYLFNISIESITSAPTPLLALHLTTIKRILWSLRSFIAFSRGVAMCRVLGFSHVAIEMGIAHGVDFLTIAQRTPIIGNFYQTPPEAYREFHPEAFLADPTNSNL